MFKHAEFESVKAWLAHPDYRLFPLHTRVHRAIRQLIIQGALETGTPLPASRRLASSLNVSRDTIEMAYTQLRVDGFITRKVGSGSRVSAQALGLAGAKLNVSSAMLPKVAALSRRGRAIFNSGGLRDFLSPRPFAPGVPDTREFPLAAWERLQRQVLKERGTAILGHSHPQGVPELRQAIAHYINLERGAQAHPEQILVVTSSQQALTLCATVLLDPGDAIVIENPVYQGARKAFKAAGLHCLPIGLDKQGIRIEQIEQCAPQAKAMYLTPSHQYPSGSTLALERRLQVIEWAHRHEAWIIEDDYDSEFHYEGRPTSCVQGLDGYDRTIYIGTFTKSLFPGLRIAYLVLPAPLVEAFTIARSLQDGHSAPIAQLTLARFIEGAHFATYIRTMRQIYGERRNSLARLITSFLPYHLQPIVPAGGMQMPCMLADELSEQELVRAAARANIELLGLSTLFDGHPLYGGVLMGFAAYNVKEQTAAIQLLQHTIHHLADKNGSAPR